MTNPLSTKPVYCPQAVATERGWVDPRNGELLVTYKNLKTIIDNMPPEQPEVKPDMSDQSMTQKILDSLYTQPVSEPDVESQNEPDVDVPTQEEPDVKPKRKYTKRVKPTQENTDEPLHD